MTQEVIGAHPASFVIPWCTPLPPRIREPRPPPWDLLPPPGPPRLDPTDTPQAFNLDTMHLSTGDQRIPDSVGHVPPGEFLEARETTTDPVW